MTIDVALKQASNFDESSHPYGNTLQLRLGSIRSTSTSQVGTEIRCRLSNSDFPDGVDIDTHYVLGPETGASVSGFDFWEISQDGSGEDRFHDVYGSTNAITLYNDGASSITIGELDMYVAYNATGSHLGQDAQEIQIYVS